ncbi:MAG: hypothetical protein JZU67_04365, partial [Burkholderiaceae bacterium]|nr:hypothetical protein [Burkholderiaceae bacterium]
LALIPPEANRQLSASSIQRFSIATSTLVQIENEEILKFFLDDLASFLTCMQRHYPWKSEQLSQYENLLDWTLLSTNAEISWSIELMDVHVEKW